MREIDAFMADEERIEEMSQDEHLKRLLELHDKANLLHHPVAKVKRLKLLKQEITKVRRKLSMDRTAIGLTENEELLDSESLGVSNKKGSIEEVSSPGNARRLR